MNWERPMSRNQTLALRNRQKSPVVLRLEPWGEEYPLEPGAVINLSFSGPEAGPLEIEFGVGEITVYGWEGSMVAVDQPH